MTTQTTSHSPQCYEAMHHAGLSCRVVDPQSLQGHGISIQKIIDTYKTVIFCELSECGEERTLTSSETFFKLIELGEMFTSITHDPLLWAVVDAIDEGKAQITFYP